MNFINCYNKLEIDRINELMKANPMLAKFEIEKYLTKFPNYYWGYVMQANILIILGEIQKSLDGKTINGLGKLEGGNFDLNFITDEIASYEMLFNITAYD